MNNKSIKQQIKNTLMKIFTLISIALFIVSITQAQVLNFETTGNEMIWNEMANAGVAPMVVENPDYSEINESDSVLFFDIQTDANAWAGTWADIEEFKVEGNGIIRIMVWKPVISDIGFKIEGGETGTGDALELKIANTLTEEWEILEFDFSEKAGDLYARIVVMPEFTETRDGNTLCYVDNIEFFVEQTGIAQIQNASFLIYASNNKVAFKGIDQVQEVEVFNMYGQMVVSDKSNAIQSVEISNLQRGVYVVKARSGNEIAVAKITKQ